MYSLFWIFLGMATANALPSHLPAIKMALLRKLFKAGQNSFVLKLDKKIPVLVPLTSSTSSLPGLTLFSLETSSRQAYSLPRTIHQEPASCQTSPPCPFHRCFSLCQRPFCITWWPVFQNAKLWEEICYRYAALCHMSVKSIAVLV